MDAYQVLGVRHGASLVEIKAAYRQRMMACHPDKGGSEAEAKLVNRAFELLTKPPPEPPPVYYQRPTVIIRVFTSSSRGYTDSTTTGAWSW